jgi:GMP synthase (glutamine-hydrolysing)
MAGAILDGLHDSAIVIHWHGDTFDLPSGAVRLASTLACPNQMYSFGDRAFAIQFHVELTEREVLDWLTSDADFVRKANGLNGAARLVEETAIYIEGYRPAARRLLHNVFRAMFRT